MASLFNEKNLGPLQFVWILWGRLTTNIIVTN